MGIANFASRSTYKLFTGSGSGGALTVASGGNIQVCGFVFEATTDNNTVFTVTDASDNVLFKFAQVKTSLGSSSHVDICFMADAGLKIQSSRSDGSVVVFHNSPGN